MVLGEMTPLLLSLWRERHPDGGTIFPLNLELLDLTEQSALEFQVSGCFENRNQPRTHGRARVVETR
jgi:hypothetical protein